MVTPSRAASSIAAIFVTMPGEYLANSGSNASLNTNMVSRTTSA